MFELRHLRYFVAVAEEQNVSRAAEKLNISQSPLSRQIRQLEQILGTALFERRKQRVYLTCAGKYFLKDALNILRYAENSTERMREYGNSSRGRLDVGYVEGAMWGTHLPLLLNDFKTNAPGVSLKLHGLGSRAQTEAVAMGELDVAIVHEPSSSEALSRLKLCTEHYTVGLSEDVYRNVNEGASLADLGAYPWVTPPRTERSSFWKRFSGVFTAAGIGAPAYEIKEISTALGLVKAGAAIGLFQSSILESAGSLVTSRRLRDPLPPIETWLCWRQSDPSPLVQAFVDLAER